MSQKLLTNPGSGGGPAASARRSSSRLTRPPPATCSVRSRWAGHITAEVAGVPSGVVRLVTDEGQLLQSRLPASGAGSVTWGTTPRQSAYVRLEVRHPLADGTAGNGSAVSATPAPGSMAR